LEEVVDIRGLVGIGILDDPRQDKCFNRLEEIQRITRDLPLQISCNKEQFLTALNGGTLPRNVMYWIDDGVGTVEEGNRIMELVYDY
jgi:hypothetical protein